MRHPHPDRTLTARAAPRRAATRRYTLTLRRRLPNERLLIEDLEARASGRRAQRIRTLLLLGLDRDPPPNALDHGGISQAETGTMRVTVLIHEIDPEDAVLRAALAEVGPLNRQEWLRDRLAAGLCGVDVPLDVVQAQRVQPPAPRSSAQVRAPLDRSTTPTPRAVEVWNDDAEAIPSAVTIEHEARPTQGLEAIEMDVVNGNPGDDDGEPKLSDFARLFA